MKGVLHNEPRPVRVVNAPGFIDFDGEALAEVTYDDAEAKTVVKAVFDGTTELLVVPSRCVSGRE